MHYRAIAVTGCRHTRTARTTVMQVADKSQNRHDPGRNDCRDDAPWMSCDPDSTDEICFPMGSRMSLPVRLETIRHTGQSTAVRQIGLSRREKTIAPRSPSRAPVGNCSERSNITGR